MLIRAKKLDINSNLLGRFYFKFESFKFFEVLLSVSWNDYKMKNNDKNALKGSLKET